MVTAPTGKGGTCGRGDWPHGFQAYSSDECETIAMSTFLFEKEVDQSLLKSGLTIPVDSHQKVQNAVGVQLLKGQKVEIKILLDGQLYNAILINLNLGEKYASRTMLQIRYAEGSSICQRLKTLFSDEGLTDSNTQKGILEVYSNDSKNLEFKVKKDLIIETKGVSMRQVLEKIMNDYVSAKSEQITGHPLGTYFRNDIPRALYDTGLVNSNRYLITGSVGQGNWAMVPWICIFDRRITTSATKGVYIVYLLAKTGDTLYLTFNQGCTEIRSNHSRRETIEIMRAKADKIISKIDSRGFRTDEEINLGDGLTELGVLYQKGTIFYKEYKKEAVPDEAELRDDLAKMMDIYRDYVREFEKSNVIENVVSEKTDGEEGEEKLTVKDTIERIKGYIEAQGFSYQDGLIENFFLSLKSKPFVILAGTSGTGKTRLVKLFAEAVGANINNGRYKMVSVRPDWSDSTDLFGHVDLNGRFIPGAIIDFIKRAELDSTHPYFLCLDEMNLARVEYYLSDFLSVVETRDFQGGHITSEPLVSDKYYGSDSSAAGKYGTVLFPENLYVIGTVNMDETTFPFSRKVLDRANTIEFSFVDLTPPAEWAFNASAPLNLANEFLKTKYLLLAQCADQQDSVNTYCVELQKLNRILQQANAHVGYRVRDEIVFYLLNNKNANLLPENEAMDNEIMQKILPRIQGSSASIKNMLCGLFRECAGEYEGQNTESDLSSKMMKVAQKSDCKYPKSAQKIAFMVRRFEEDGFTSYWL